ncbi:MAG: transcription termination/antitermination NusG family protein, partial [Nitrospirales bacterium]
MLWYAVRTKPSCEAATNKKLTAEGISTLFLRYNARSIRNHRVSWVEAPYFPTYLFVQPKPTQ